MAQESQFYSKEYEKVDSLIRQDLPKSAQEVLQKIRAAAIKANLPVEVMKANMLMLNTWDYEENSFQSALKEAQEQLEISQTPYRQVWHSVIASLYEGYFDNNFYEIIGRTPLEQAQKSSLEFWDAHQFYNTITFHYLASLNPKEELSKIDVRKFSSVLTEQKNTVQLRPTLYDILAHRALDYLKNTNKEIVKPEHDFTLNSIDYLQPSASFVKYSITSPDTTNLQWKALLIYQELEKMHLNNTDALVDVQLHRLKYVYDNMQAVDKNKVYTQSLLKIVNDYPNSDQSADAKYLLATLSLKQEKPDIVSVIEELHSIITQYPKTKAAVEAQNKINDLKRPSLAIQNESVILPKEYSRIKVDYQNVHKAYFQVYKVPTKIFLHLKENYDNSLKSIDSVLKSASPMQVFEHNLLQAKDHKKHSTEIILDPYPIGCYVIKMSSEKNFSKNDTTIAMSLFQVSGIAALTHAQETKPSLTIIDRKTGQPIQGAKVVLQSNKKTVMTPADGKVIIDKVKYTRDYAIISKGEDSLINGYNTYHYYSSEGNNEYQKVYLFTDRAIYRPGQKVFFKGIKLKIDPKGKNTMIVPNSVEEIRLYDVNHQEVSKIDLKTNEYGSFHGSFILPNSGLTGQMSISTSLGTVYFNVEEYKRPTFEVLFDSLKDNYILGQAINVKGKAKAFSGSNISNSKLKYTVNRVARFPYYWLFAKYGMPQIVQQQIASGVAQTNADGQFEIVFNAIPDSSINRKTLAVFAYEVNVDVTDINGETHSNSQVVQAGYTDVKIVHNIPSRATSSELKSLNVKTVNANDVSINKALTVSVIELLDPGYVVRKRYWAAPDVYTIDESTFRKKLPIDEYENEGNPANWKRGKLILKKSVTTNAQGIIKLNELNINKNGFYLVVLESIDGFGNDVSEMQHVFVQHQMSNEVVHVPLIINPITKHFEVGDKVKLSIKSGYKDAHLLVVNILPLSQPNFSSLNLKNYSVYKDLIIDEDSRGGIQYLVSTVKDNRVYNELITINVPWTEKELQINWETHRDILKPGSKETWRINISGYKKDRVNAELLATLYDASLDQFSKLYWQAHAPWPSLSYLNFWNTLDNFSTDNSKTISFNYNPHYDNYNKVYSELLVPKLGYGLRRMRYSKAVMMKVSTVRMKGFLENAVQDELSDIAPASAPAPAQSLQDTIQKNGTTQNTDLSFSPRTNLNETAFFLPQMLTDEQGNIVLEFEMPEALTRWNFKAFAHTKDFKTGEINGSIITQKELMVTPNLPRFFRQGDVTVISSKIANLTNVVQSGHASIDVIDAITNKNVNNQFDINQNKESFQIGSQQNGEVSWSIKIPEHYTNPVHVIVKAASEKHTDGEQHTLAVVSNRLLLTETKSLFIKGNDTKEFTLDKLLNSYPPNTPNSSLVHQNFTIEYTPNPSWYVVQALPYLMEYPYECAEQTFNRYYANAIGNHILKQQPQIKDVFKQWQNEPIHQKDKALESPLEKNELLKSSVLAETPWVLDAQSESTQRKNIALLFDDKKINQGLDNVLQKLQKMVLPSGGFGWFHGMREDPYITNYVLTGFGKLQHLKISLNKSATSIIKNGVAYMDREILKRYNDLVKVKSASHNQQHISAFEIQYFYMRSYFMNLPLDEKSKVAYDFYQKQLEKYWSSFNPYLKAMIGLALNRNNNLVAPQNIWKSLNETAIKNDELGMYWKENAQRYLWWNMPIEQQAVLIEFYDEVAKDNDAVDLLKTWLLQQKHTHNWGTTKATADACYAFLLKGTQSLAQQPSVSINLGQDQLITSNSVDQQAGSGYFKTSFKAQDVKPSFGKIKVRVENASNNTPSWGAAYWQYFEDYNKVTAAANGLVVRKQFFIQEITSKGKVLIPITEANSLKVGDLVKVRVEIESDRDLQYVHLKDMRPACFEPINVLSGYRYQNGLGYYESTKDVSSSFFIDFLRKGKYVFEYSVRVNNQGNYSGGLTTIQCMYAPEFAAHTEGVQVVVK